MLIILADYYKTNLDYLIYRTDKPDMLWYYQYNLNRIRYNNCYNTNLFLSLLNKINLPLDIWTEKEYKLYYAKHILKGYDKDKAHLVFLRELTLGGSQ